MKHVAVHAVAETDVCISLSFSLIVDYGFSNSAFGSLGFATLRGMEVIHHHISLQKHLTDFQNSSFSKPVMNIDLLKLGFGRKLLF
jgi:hypothetical protein